MPRAIVLAAEGNGVSRVRRKSGVEAIAGEKTELFEGDKITSSATSIIDLMLPNGIYARLGNDSEYRLNKIVKVGISSQWEFQLLKGSALISLGKSQNPNLITLKIITPNAFIGLAQGDSLISFDASKGITRLTSLSERSWMGGLHCPQTNSCEAIPNGKTAEMKKDSTKPIMINDYLGIDLKGKEDPKNSQILSLFANKKNQAQPDGLIIPNDVKKLVMDSLVLFHRTQDSFLGRTELLRNQMFEAMEKKNFNAMIEVARIFEEKVGFKKDKESAINANKISVRFELASALARIGLFQNQEQEKGEMKRPIFLRNLQSSKKTFPPFENSFSEKDVLDSVDVLTVKVAEAALKQNEIKAIVEKSKAIPSSPFSYRGVCSNNNNTLSYCEESEKAFKERECPEYPSTCPASIISMAEPKIDKKSWWKKDKKRKKDDGDEGDDELCWSSGAQVPCDSVVKSSGSSKKKSSSTNESKDSKPVSPKK